MKPSLYAERTNGAARRAAVALALALAAVGCGDNGGSGDPDDPVLVSMALSPATVTLELGASQSLTVTGTFDDGTSGPLSSGVTWESSAISVATVNGAGVVAAIAGGTATITARRDGLSATAEVTVSETVTGRPVFTDDFGAGLSFMAFGGSDTTIEVDASQAQNGSRSLRLDVPASGYAGGALVASPAIDVSSFNALTFWVKGSKAATLNVVGYGNDLGASAYMVEWGGVPVTETWTRHVVPLVSPAALTANAGVFHFAEGSDEGAYQIWFDDIRYETVDAASLGTPSPAIATEALTQQVGDIMTIAGRSVTYTLGGVMRTFSVAAAYFTFTSSMPDVASVDAGGRVTALAVGTTSITASLGGVPAVGEITLEVTALVTPTEPAPAPTAAAEDVIALFSDAYEEVAVNTWRTDWSDAALEDTTIGDDAVKKYTNLRFVGVEALGPNAVDAAEMTHFHVDVWVPAASTFRIKLVDFGADNTFGGGDDTEHELAYDAETTPAIAPGAWSSLDIPLADFTGLTARGHVSQLIFSMGSPGTAYIDNVYFHRVTPPME